MGEPDWTDMAVKLPQEISLRDWLAGQALVGILSTSAAPAMLGLQGAEPHTAKTAYELADAMLAERNPKGGEE